MHVEAPPSVVWFRRDLRTVGHRPFAATVHGRVIPLRLIPELAKAPKKFLQEPWARGGAAKLIGNRYPARIVDLAASTEEATYRMHAARMNAGYKDAANAIQEKHGSRKSAMPRTGQKRRGKPKAARPAGQLELDL